MNCGPPTVHENVAVWGGAAMLSGSRDGGARAVVLAGALLPVSESGPGMVLRAPVCRLLYRQSTQSRSFYSAAPSLQEASTMDVLRACCAGLDVHKQEVVVCVRELTNGGSVRQEVRTCRTEANALLEVA